MAPHRARFVATTHMAAAGHYLAAQAAFAVLEAGGNAVDAGVAGGIALSVLQSELVSFGGVAPILLRMAETGEPWTISGLGWWPASASRARLEREHGHIPDGLLSTVVPAAPDAWLRALERFGTVSFAEVARPSTAFARDGFPVSSLMSEIIEDAQQALRRWPANEALYLPEGRVPAPGERFVNPDLARTIQYMVDEEAPAARRGGRRAGLAAARDAFYRGAIAEAICSYHTEHGGWLAREDLAAFRSDVEPALRTRAGSLDILCCGPWCQGPVLPQAMKILQGFDLAALGHNSCAYIHTVTEALKLSFADRHHHYGDPRFVDVPIDLLLSDAYAARRRGAIRADRAAPGMPVSGLKADAGTRSRPGGRRVGAAPASETLDTSFICVVDRYGNAFAATPSDMAASAPVVPGLGFVPSNRGTQSWIDPEVPACMAPGKRPRLTPSPSIAITSEGWLVPIGSPGNDVQLQAVLQVLLNVAVFGMAPQEAVERPRFATLSFPRSSEPHGYTPGLLMLEDRMSPEVADELRARGHKPSLWPAWAWRAGAVCGIIADTRSGFVEGMADPRRPTGMAGV